MPALVEELRVLQLRCDREARKPFWESQTKLGGVE